MSASYDPSKVGVPYVRVSRLIIDWPADALPTAYIEQALGVTLADGSARQLEALPALTVTLDLAAHGDDPVPMVNPANGEPIGMDTTLNQAFLAVFAIIRQTQIATQG